MPEVSIRHENSASGCMSVAAANINEPNFYQPMTVTSCGARYGKSPDGILKTG